MPMKPGDLALHELDLNLIPYMVAIEETRNVSQLRVSTALGRLREYFSDPLFVRTSRGMEPTPRALTLVPVAREALNRIERALESGDIDLAVGYFPDLAGNNFFQQRLFLHRFICLMRRDHPCSRGPLTLAQ